MFGKLKTVFGKKRRKPKGKTSRSSRGASREEKSAASPHKIKKTEQTSRELPIPHAGSQFMASFEGFRRMLKDLSQRVEAIKENPEETYLINTEVNLRVLDVLENLSALTERNTVALENLAGQSVLKEHAEPTSTKKRRAREVLAVLERVGPLTYEELRKELKPEVTYNRVTALVSEMIRDGVPLHREGKPVRVGIGDNLTGSN